MRFVKGMLALALASMLAACATQQAMTVNSGTIASQQPRYKNAVAVRSVTGGAAMNVLTQPGVPNEPLKARQRARDAGEHQTVFDGVEVRGARLQSTFNGRDYRVRSPHERREKRGRRVH
jgi:hypothetical protein